MINRIRIDKSEINDFTSQYIRAIIIKYWVILIPCDLFAKQSSGDSNDTSEKEYLLICRAITTEVPFDADKSLCCKSIYILGLCQFFICWVHFLVLSWCFVFSFVGRILGNGMLARVKSCSISLCGL
jgi:hypothetical protein